MTNLYNEFRPHSFEAVLGQEQTIAILKRQAISQNFAHSYLFYGQSGTGKTTTARILASCFNCLSMNGTGEPCGECDNCRTISIGQNWDVFEVDAARFRGIDSIRDLCYKASFTPMGKKKVYILDEVHALTDEAFNCLLRLLEEPPPHLVLILCTTNIEGIPEVVKSRCQLFPFKALQPVHIRKKLDAICQKIGIVPDPRHLQFIAESSNGNCRSAENMLEQVCCLESG